MGQTTTAPTIDWFDPSVDADPYPQWRRMQREAPVAIVPEFGFQYVVTRYEDVKAVAADIENFGAQTAGGEQNPVWRTHKRSLLLKDGEQHATEKRAIGRAVRNQAIASTWSTVFTRNAERFINDLLDAGSGADFMAIVAGPYASANLSDVLGFGGIVDHQTMSRWSEGIVAVSSNFAGIPEVTELGAAVAAEIDEALDEALLRKADSDEPTVIGMQAAAGIPVENIRGNVKLIIGGGVNEPRAALGAGVHFFLANPDQLRALLEGRVEFTKGFDEVVRINTPIAYTGRQAVRDMQLSSVTIPEGASVMLGLAAANRDETIFDSPDAFDITRPEHPTALPFGGGVHFCSGSWVSRAAVGKIAWPMLWERIPNLRVAEHAPKEAHGHTFRSFSSLEVEW